MGAEFRGDQAWWKARDMDAGVIGEMLRAADLYGKGHVVASRRRCRSRFYGGELRIGERALYLMGRSSMYGVMWEQLGTGDCSGSFWDNAFARHSQCTTKISLNLPLG